MRILITGAFGFAGRHLIRELSAARHELVAFDLNDPPGGLANTTAYTGDIRDADKVEQVVADARPDACIHLGAISFVPDGFSNIMNVFAVNLTGTLNVLEGFRKHAADARILIVSSSEVYGHAPRKPPVREDDLLDPENPYAISKAAADRVARFYARRHGMRTIIARPGNHIGPGQSSMFVAPSLARQVAAIARGDASPRVEAGNLESARDFTDVRDVARAYRLLLEKGRTGKAYNIASGRAMKIRDLFKGLCAVAGVNPEVKTDPKLVRTEEARPLLDITRIGKDTGWKPEIPLADTLRDILADAGNTT